MKKNVASQKVGAQMVSASDGSAFTGSVTVAVTVDAGTQATGSVGSGACTHEGGGYHTYAPAQAETNGDLLAFTFSGTGAIPVTVQVYTSFPQTADAPTAAANADAVWDEVRSGHTTVGTFGEISTPADIADAVCDEALSGHTTAGSLGKVLSDAGAAVDTEVAAIKTKTDFLPSVTAGAAGGLFIAGSNAATTVNITGNITGNLSGSVGSVTAAAATTSNIKKNQALASFMFVMRDSTNHAPATGKTVSVFISKDGAAFAAAATATATEVSNGWYKISFTQTEMNANVIALRMTATACDDYTATILTQP